ncbi:hypothetical protein HOO68_05930 [Candidatus Gracilibacteria bacterium]|nr:hypothetical protein [Candidatus Gracilibacteria bacterium]
MTHVALAVPINAILGASANGPVSNFPLAISTLCTVGVNESTCPLTFHPSWTDGDRFWGVTGSVGAFACVTSSDVGLTWQQCPTLPFVAKQAQNIAETSNGNIVAVGDVSSVCQIRLSTDAAVSWTTVFNGTVPCTIAAKAQSLYCQPTTGQCDFGLISGGNGFIYRTTDNGLTWSETAMGAGVSVTSGGIAFDGNSGIIGGDPAFGARALVAAGNVWGVSSPWGISSLLRGTPLLFGGATPQMISQNGAVNEYHRTDGNGTLIQVLGTLPFGLPGFSQGLRCLYWDGSMYYCFGATTIGSGIWVTTDNFVSFITLSNTTRQVGFSTGYKLGTRLFMSFNAGGVNPTFLVIQ